MSNNTYQEEFSLCKDCKQKKRCTAPCRECLNREFDEQWAKMKPSDECFTNSLKAINNICDTDPDFFNISNEEFYAKVRERYTNDIGTYLCQLYKLI